jgi:FkbM family methyltransferase
LALVTRARLSGKPLPVEVLVPGVEHPVHLRLRTTDTSLLEEIIIYAEYDWAFQSEPMVIVDAGANIGLSAGFFARKYPKARIVAIEPEPGNFETLLKNVAPYPNVTPLRAALWSENCDLNLFDSDQGEWGFQTRSAAAADTKRKVGMVPGVTVDQLMAQFDLPCIDLLKVDIEGSEKEVFADASRWIGRVNTIVVELHDRFKAGCSRSFYAATRDFAGEWHKGEITVVARSTEAIAGFPKPRPEMTQALPFVVRAETNPVHA